jgi:hypothetical protein
MISADPTVPGALNSQAFNRYSYVLNNPLAMTDPSGFTPLIGVCGGTPRCAPNEDGGGGIDQMHIPYEFTTCEDGSNGTGGCFDNGYGLRGAGYAHVNADVGEIGNTLIDFLAGHYTPGVSRRDASEGASAFTDAVFWQNEDGNWALYFVTATVGAIGSISLSAQTAQAEFGGDGANTLVSLAFTDTAVPSPSEHALVLIVDLNSGAIRITRAGPQGSTLASLGNVVAVDGVFGHANVKDFPTQVHTLQLVGASSKSFMQIATSAAHFRTAVNNLGRSYAFFGPNSNSYAFSFVQYIGFQTPRPVLPVWGSGVCIGPHCHP